MKAAMQKPATVDVSNIEDFKMLCEKFLPTKAAKFVKAQAELFQKQPKGRRYSRAFNQFCLSVGPKAYRSLSKTFCLPTVQTLNALTRRFKLSPGLHDTILQSLQAKVSVFTELNKYCSICIDEI